MSDRGSWTADEIEPVNVASAPPSEIPQAAISPEPRVDTQPSDEEIAAMVDELDKWLAAAGASFITPTESIVKRLLQVRARAVRSVTPDQREQETLAMAVTSWLHDNQGSEPLGTDLMREALGVTGVVLQRRSS